MNPLKILVELVISTARQVFPDVEFEPSDENRADLARLLQRLWKDHSQEIISTLLATPQDRHLIELAVATAPPAEEDVQIRTDAPKGDAPAEP